MKDHQYDLPIKKIMFHDDLDLVLSMDTKILKLWDRNSVLLNLFCLFYNNVYICHCAQRSCKLIAQQQSFKPVCKVDRTPNCHMKGHRFEPLDGTSFFVRVGVLSCLGILIHAQSTDRAGNDSQEPSLDDSSQLYTV